MKSAYKDLDVWRLIVQVSLWLVDYIHLGITNLMIEINQMWKKMCSRCSLIFFLTLLREIFLSESSYSVNKLIINTDLAPVDLPSLLSYFDYWHFKSNTPAVWYLEVTNNKACLFCKQRLCNIRVAKKFNFVVNIRV